MFSARIFDGLRFWSRWFGTDGLVSLVCGFGWVFLAGGSTLLTAYGLVVVGVVLVVYGFWGVTLIGLGLY